MVRRSRFVGTAFVASLAVAAGGLAQPGGAHAAPRCAGADSISAGVKKKEAAFRCLLNAERAERELPRLRWRATPARGARRSSALMVRCSSFSHTPCGERPATTVRRAGFRGRFAGENVAWGSGRLGSARSIFIGWMRSPGHRRNMLNPRSRAAGVGARGRVRFQGVPGVHVWTLELAVR